MKNIINIIFFVFAILIVFFILSNGNIENVLSPGQQLSNRTVFISPRNVRYVSPRIPVIPATVYERSNLSSTNSESKHHSLNARFSPTNSISSVSTFDVDVEYKNNLNKMGKIDIGYNFSTVGRKFRSLGEQLCCKTFEEFLGRKVLTNTRPDFMKNPKTKRNLELDVYDPVSKIAIEYNGIQHGDSEDSEEGFEEAQMGFGMTREKFEDQKYRDKLKEILCKNEGIHLIVVPYKVDSNVKNYTDKSGKSKKRYSYPPPEEREKRIYNYIIPRIQAIFS